MLSFVLDKNGKLLFANGRAQKLFSTGIDYTMDLEFVCFSIEGIELFKQQCLEKIKTNCSFEISIPSKNNEKTYYKIHSSYLKEDNGQIFATAFFARNIDKEHRLEEEKESYIATLNHDLKTPAIAQIRALEILLSGQMGEFNESQKEILSLTLDSCNYLYEMVRTLLNSTRANSKNISLQYTGINITNLLNECISEVYIHAKNKAVTMNYKFPKSDLYVNADGKEIKQVMLNLLSNAINYVFSNSDLTISLNIVDKNLEFCVSGFSPYIKPEILDGLFKKNISHSEKLNKLGFGLGFYHSKTIIEAHGGKIIAQSNKNNSVFIGFTIPIYCNNLNSERIMLQTV
jgi:signal transduction histidine kinase